MLAYNPYFTKKQYKKVVDAEISSGHLPAHKYDEMPAKGSFFIEKNTDETGFNGHWTKDQTYLALGNVLHTAARMGIDSSFHGPK